MHLHVATGLVVIGRCRVDGHVAGVGTIIAVLRQVVWSNIHVPRRMFVTEMSIEAEGEMSRCVAKSAGG